MSITDELRMHASMVSRVLIGDRDELTAIADRIDAEHEKGIVDALLNDGLPMSDEVMAEHGWIRMPVDADGEPINIGDVMAYKDNTKPIAVIALVPPAVFLTEEGPRYADMCRHYHKPTVEDMLREFGKAWVEWEDGSPYDPIAKYAAKLRLADDGKEQ